MELNAPTEEQEQEEKSTKQKWMAYKINETNKTMKMKPPLKYERPSERDTNQNAKKTSNQLKPTAKA